MELLFTGGRVLTMDGLERVASAVAVRDGKIIAVGDSGEVRQSVSPDATRIDLRGRALTPGFCDPHNHFSMTTFEPVSVDCRIPPLAGKPAVLDAIAAAAESAPAGQWVWGLGYSARHANGGWLTRSELDDVAPDNPVCVMDYSYHASYANSAAMAIAGIHFETPDPRGGQILRDESGEATGMLYERASDLVHHASMRSHIDTLGPEIVADLVEQNALRHLSHGVTSVGDAVVMPESAEMYRLADERGKLPIVIHQMRGGNGFFAAPEAAAGGAFLQDDVSDRLRGGIVKLFMDPVYPSNALRKCHADGTFEDVGEPYYNQDEVDQLVLNAASHGLQTAIHCLGNRAIEQALNTYERVQREIPRSDARYRIEHFFFADPGQMERAASLGVIISHQPAFLYSVGQGFVDFIAEAGLTIPPLPYRSFLDAGVTVASGSDFPCAPVEPLIGLYGLSARRSRDGDLIAEEETLSPLEALRTQTINSAVAMFRDHEVGSIEVGKRADLVVLSHDPTLVDAEFIREISVQQTYVDGELLYSV
ncbi:MAG: amidohydrolase [Chloroflexi bacterium]|nr:amidohydrolase [Chloroflexota bacterium]MCY3696605.1 amidohydrolase [Chloroflexota bacterium]